MRLLDAVREEQVQALRLDDANEHARARARLLQAIDQIDRGGRADRVGAEGRAAQPAKPSRAGWRWGLGAVAAAACALAVVFAWPSERPLEFQVDGVELAANQQTQVIHAGARSRALAFSDSTTIELSPGGRMYIDELRSHGASVVLETGEIALAVHHEDDTSWQVAAGPWTVHVTGTRFSVAWEPSAQSFRVAVVEGSVRVEGPEGETADLRAGDTLIRERGEATSEPEDLGADDTNLGPRPIDSEPVAVRTEPQTGTGDGAAASETETKPKQAAPKPPRWDEYFANSEYAKAWDALAELPGGIEGEAEQASADTLLDLADVAHYTRHSHDARKLLEQLRERFPGSDEAGEAAFALGRLAANGGSQAKAATWFELYLDERPQGSLAGDALARLMDSYDALGRSADASATATRYLDRFPSGPHAGKAQKIVAR
ncbi:FecR domain-containing protein [Enhygromyxa salina]|uniref:FecR domain-containing protein n=1 Tax=Enhygromyxa salina TaxID=215803 RepID=UPI0015E5A42E|nr:FecR domain-containing protein [Enhygromyxa salina]